MDDDLVAGLPLASRPRRPSTRSPRRPSRRCGGPRSGGSGTPTPGSPSAAQTLLKFTPAAITRTTTSKAPGSRHLDLLELEGVDAARPRAPARITQAAIVSGSVPGSTPTSVTFVRSTCAIVESDPPGSERRGSYRARARRSVRRPAYARQSRWKPQHHSARPASARSATALVVDGLVVDDECAVRLVREREEAGEDPVGVVVDAIEIGARVLDREQAGANAEFVRERVRQGHARGRGTRSPIARARWPSSSAEGRRGVRRRDRPRHEGARAALLGRQLGGRAEPRARGRRRGDGAGRARTSCGSSRRPTGSNPLADFKAGTVRPVHRRPTTPGRQPARAARAGWPRSQKELQALRAEREKLEELEAERERGTAKGRTFEEQVAEALDAHRRAPGRRLRGGGRPHGRRPGKTRRRRGRASTAAAGRRAARIVFEAKNSQAVASPRRSRSSTSALRERDADFAVLVVPERGQGAGEDAPAARVQRRQADRHLRPRGGHAARLEVAYSLARARVLMPRSEATASTPPPCATPSSARSPRWRTCARIKSSSRARRRASTGARDLLDDDGGPGARRTCEHIDELVLAAGEPRTRR